MIALGLLSLAFVLYPLLGKSFIPIMKEGSITPVIIRVPSISLEEAMELEMEAMKLIAKVPGVRTVVSKLGRGESPADPGIARTSRIPLRYWIWRDPAVPSRKSRRISARCLRYCPA